MAKPTAEEILVFFTQTHQVGNKPLAELTPAELFGLIVAEQQRVIEKFQLPSAARPIDAVI